LLLYLKNTYVCENFGGAIARLLPLWLRAWIKSQIQTFQRLRLKIKFLHGIEMQLCNWQRNLWRSAKH